jgi:hypothetical protein
MPEEITLPKMKTTPWSHQVEAYKFGFGKKGVILALDMGCVDGDAIVNAYGGSVRIKDLAAPNLVRALCGNQIRLNQVVTVIKTGIKPVLLLKTACGRSLRLTYDHEVAIDQAQYVRADALRYGDDILADDGGCNLELDTVLSVEPDGEAEVYDLVMEDPHRNFVANGIVVHNCGKSWVAAALVAGRDHRRVLITCPLSVVPVWPKQFATHSARNELVLPLIGPVSKKRDIAEKAIEFAKDRPLVLVINHESAWREPFGTWAMRAGFDCVIHDECHRLKSAQGKASIWASRMAKVVPYRIGLSGTPFPHSPLDGYGVCRAIDSAVFGGSFVGYRNRWAIMGGFEGKQVIGWRNLDELNRLFYTIAIRKTKAECLDLPDFHHVIVPIKMTGRSAKLYRDLETDFIAEVRSGVITAGNALVRMLRLQQMTSGYCVVDGVVERIGEEKQKALADLLEDVGRDEPFVVFCRFRHDLREIERVATEAGRKYYEVSGDRKELDAWNADKPGAVLGVQTQSGGLGIDLTKSRYVCYYSQVLSLGDYEQSLARVHRPGQTRSVTYFHLLAGRTVDEKIHVALREHKSVIDEVLRRAKEDPNEDFGIDETIVEEE